MKSKYSVDDLRDLADDLERKIREQEGYAVYTDLNVACGKYGCVVVFPNGKVYTTGLDSKDTCADKLKSLIESTNDLVVRYCESFSV